MTKRIFKISDLKKHKNLLKNKTLVVFDLDGTLTPTKSNIEARTAKLVSKLLEKKSVAIIGGGGYEQFQKQFIHRLNISPKLLKNLFIFPTTATSFYRYKHGWQKVYREKFSNAEKKKIMMAFPKALQKGGYVQPERTYGELIEDRGSQISFSALGQDIVAVLGKRGIALKEKWKRENTDLKLRIARILQKLLPEFEARAAGYTTIDVTRKGVDKAYGIYQIKKHLGVDLKKILFIGDALFPGGNDYAAAKAGVDCIKVSGPDETNKLIRFLIQ